MQFIFNSTLVCITAISTGTVTYYCSKSNQYFASLIQTSDTYIMLALLRSLRIWPATSYTMQHATLQTRKSCIEMSMQCSKIMYILIDLDQVSNYLISFLSFWEKRGNNLTFPCHHDDHMPLAWNVGTQLARKVSSERQINIYDGLLS